MFDSNHSVKALGSAFKKMLPKPLDIETLAAKAKRKGKRARGGQPAAQRAPKQEDPQGAMPDIGKNNLLCLVECIFRVSEAYFHDWEVEAPELNKKDVQIVQEVIDASVKRIYIDTAKCDSLHALHVNTIWALLDDPQ